ncbi:MAG TPA: ADP-glyceromanno-heptose 6-epimerase [Stellaceae bacterium]|nr:ADP-glyceromanno-heptose 6-epimerase [Stellaceae bacterium]
MIVVTGGAGFIGSNLVAALEERAAGNIVVSDFLGQEEKWRNLAKRELAAVVPPDRLFAYLDEHTAKIETIFHMGAISATTERDVDLIVASNFALSQRLWDWCTLHQRRLIYASSAATYGDGSAGFDDDFTPSALANLRPLNAYGWSKHLFDRRIARLVADNAPRPKQWAGLKFFNVYGPNEYHKGTMKSVVAHIYPRAKAGTPARLFKSHNPAYPDGGQKRDFVYVRDCVAEMLWLYDHPSVNGLFNAGTGKARSFADLAAAVYRALGSEPKIEYVDTPIEIRDKYQYFTEAKMDRVRAAGFRVPATELEDGVRHYVQTYLAAADPYR